MVASTRALMLVLPLLAAVACDEKDVGRRDQASEESAPRLASKEVVLAAGMDGSIKLRVRISVPDGWERSEIGGDTSFRGGGFFDLLELSLACNGACGDAATLTKNLKEKPIEEMAFVKSAGHVPQLEPSWIQETKEEKPGVFFSRWLAKDKAGTEVEQHVRVDRLVDGLQYYLSCRGETTGNAKVSITVLEKACRDLEVLR